MEYKGFNIKNDGKFGMILISRVGPGAIPKSLEGYFSKPLDATRAIDAATVKGEPKVGKIKTTSRSK